MGVIEPSDDLRCAYADGADWVPWIGYSFGRPDRVYFPSNRSRTGAFDPLEGIGGRRDLARVRNIVRDAESTGKQIHVAGSGWSFSSVAFSSGYLIQTAPRNPGSTGLDGAALNEILPIEQLNIPQGVRDLSVFAHGGCTLDRIVRSIDNPGANPRRALVSYGGSSGQTLAGLISTGTHGGLPRVAPPGDAVLALMVIAEGGKVFWIQRPNGPVADGDVPYDGFDGEVIRSDSVMDAAILSLGCFGVIFGVLLRLQPMYWFNATRVDRSIPADFAWLGPGPELQAILDDAKTQFLEVVVNPYATRALPGGGMGHATRITTFAPHAAAEAPQGNMSPIDQMEVLGLVGVDAVLSQIDRAALSGMMPSHVESVFEKLRPLPSKGAWVGRCHEFLSPAAPAIRVASIEVAFPRKITAQVMSKLAGWIRAASQQPTPFAFPGAVSFRYTAPSRATISMVGTVPRGATRVAYDTTAEIFAIQAIYGADETHTRLLECADLLHDLDVIPHWGQVNAPNPVHIAEAFGPDAISSWRAAYRRINPTKRTFENDYARATGLMP